MSLLFSGSSEDLLTPSKDVVTSLEGDTVTLSCNYSAVVQTLFWYQQKSGSHPQLLMAEHSEETEKLKFIHEREKKEFHLEISSAAVSDSAVYYCALQPTVTGNSKTLYFCYMFFLHIFHECCFLDRCLVIFILSESELRLLAMYMHRHMQGIWFR
uniref:Ig-like domain-containing protein n=1 Tax=Maylandia zebra TaxID=106582 RepID=A0A3P9D9Z3_9CICH